MAREYECNGLRIDINSPEHGSSVSEETPLCGGNSERSVQSIRALPGMLVRSHAIDSGGAITKCTGKEALGGARSCTCGGFWIDIDADARNSEELRDWLGQLKLAPFLLSLLAAPPQTWASQVVALKRASLAVIQILPDEESSDETAHVAALSVKNLLLTFTSCPRSETGGLYGTALRYMADPERLPSASSSGALLAWLQFHIDRASRSTRRLRSHVLAMDEEMDRDISAVGLDEIIGVKDQLLRLLSVAEEQNECLESLAGAGAASEALDFSNLHGALSVLLATASATERMALRLEKHIADLRQRYEGHQQERINRRLALLTVISAIFLPLTLITGIWGMNFTYMPELQVPDAYPIALFAMFALATGMLFYFWRSGWLN